MVTVELRLFKKDVGCASWIAKQPPSKVAEALALCESACAALHCELSTGEMQQRSVEIQTLKKKLDTQREELSNSMKHKQAEREKVLKQKWEAVLADKESEIDNMNTKNKDEVSALRQHISELENECKKKLSAAADENQKKIDRQIEYAKSTHDTLSNEIEILQSTIMKVESSKVQLLTDMQNQVTERVNRDRSELEERYAKDLEDYARRSRDEMDSMKRRCEADATIERDSYDSKLKSAMSEIDNLKHQLSMQQNTISDVKETFRQQSDVERVAAQQREDALNEQHNLRVEELRAFVKAYETQIAQAQVQMQKSNDEKDRVIMHCNEQLQQMKKEQQEQMQQMNDEQRNFLSTLSGSQVKGAIGERFVDEVFAELEIGTLTDVSKKQREGFADRFWQYDFHSASNIPGIRGMLEIKHTKDLHSQNDIEKFNKDVKSGVAQNRINCAMMLSLTSRIHGSKQISLSFVDGIPVLRASRGTNDSLSPMSLVKMAFLTLVEIWPYLASNKSRNEDLIISTVSTFLDSQLGRVERLQPQIDFLEKTGAQMQKEASILRKTRDDMSHEIASLKMQHPQLITNECHENNDRIDTMNLLIQSVEAYKTRTKRVSYPRVVGDLDLDETVVASVTTKMFEDAVSTVRKNTRPGKKRARVESKSVTEQSA